MFFFLPYNIEIFLGYYRNFQKIVPIIASQEISATFKQHISDIQFADVACA